MSSSETGKISDHPLIIIFIYLLQGNPVEKQLIFQPPILAYDQDLGINASLQYSITKGMRMKKIWRDIEKMIRHYKSYKRLMQFEKKKKSILNDQSLNITQSSFIGPFKTFLRFC